MSASYKRSLGAGMEGNNMILLYSLFQSDYISEEIVDNSKFLTCSAYNCRLHLELHLSKPTNNSSRPCNGTEMNY